MVAEWISCDKCGYETYFGSQWKEEDKKCMFCNPSEQFKEWQKDNELV